MYINKQRLRPIEFRDQVRLGNDGDGGYVIPRFLIAQTDALVSFGVSDDWTFEEAFKRLNPAVRIEAYDPTISHARIKREARRHMEKSMFHGALMRYKNAKRHAIECKRWQKLSQSYQHFFGTGKDVRHIEKWIATASNQESIAPKEIFERLVKTEGKKAIFLKMDIEGSEYAIVDQIAAYSAEINCIVLECHEIDRTKGFQRLVTQFLKDFSIVHVHGNNICPVNENESFPVVIELTFLNNKFIPPEDRVKFSTQSYPLAGLDRPNTPYKPDIPLVFD